MNAASRKRVLVVDDDAHIRQLVDQILKRTKLYDVTAVSNGEACLARLAETQADLVLLDYQMPGIDGMETLQAIRGSHPGLPVVIMTAHGTIERAVDFMKLGAYDFLTKPFPAERLKVTVMNAIQASRLETELQSLRSELHERYHFDSIIGQSGVMQEAFRSASRVVNSEVTVLLSGESGTGKELFARAIHHHSTTRSPGRFVPVNCTALPESLLESELFGHEKGAFTGAASRRIGKFELANGGTIFLDEIGEMSQAIQAKILRVLQEREFERLGGNELVKVDIRLISATNKNLEEEVRKGRFREDLFYRISVFPIHLPPLRERREDIPLLAEFFLKRYTEREGKSIQGFGPETLRVLLGYHWPGNVRELENVVERAVVISHGPWIVLDDLPTHIVAIGRDMLTAPEGRLPAQIDRIEEEMLRKALLECEGNVSRAAKRLGIGRATIYRKAKKFGLPISK
jgi:two-component system, NtrC family, response regulator AtoC